MKLEDILQLTDPTAAITEFKKRTITAPDVTKIRNEYDPKKHLIFDETIRPDKRILKEDGTLDRIEKVNRISLAFQKLIVTRANSFLFAKKPVYTYDEKDTASLGIIQAIRRVLNNNKEVSLNREVGRELMSSTEVAELWYVVPNENNLYSFASKYKLRHLVMSPLKGDNLYPLFDAYGDMIAFSREYIVTTDGKEKTIFDVYTANEIRRYEMGVGGWALVDNQPNIIGKIPVIYATQGITEWENVQPIVDRLEKLSSNFADTNDYHGSPTIMVEGQVTGFARKGEAGKILQADPGSKAYYLSWDRAPEAIKLESERLENYIYTQTQTPNISFDNIKGLGAISGIALKLMFLDAHLKVEDKKSIVLEYLARRINVIKAFLAYMNTSWKAQVNNATVEVDITPYMIDDLKADIDNAINANGNNPVVSQKTSIKMAGIVPADNINEELLQIQKEEKEPNVSDISESYV